MASPQPPPPPPLPFVPPVMLGAAVTQLVTLQRTVVAAVQSGEIKEGFESLTRLASTRAEFSGVLLLLELFSFTDVPSFFGRTLLFLNGMSLTTWALRGVQLGAVEWWKDTVVGQELAKKVLPASSELDSLLALPLWSLAMAGITGAYAGLYGPDKNGMGVALLSSHKLVLSYVLFSTITEKTGPAAVVEKRLELMRIHLRTGLILAIYWLYLYYKGSGRANSPRYIVELETRLVQKIDQLASLQQDVKGKLETNGPVMSTPKKYSAGE